MENPPRDGPTSIMQLPDDCLYFIFQKLDSGSDRESFGLTCHRWLHIQNSSRRSLQFQCSLAIYDRSSSSQSSYIINVSQLNSLLNRFRQLQSLSLSGCMDLPDSGLSLLQHYGSKLDSLYLDCCFKITDNGLSSVTTGCPSLTSLTSISLYRCIISDIGLKTLANSCLDLKDVNLSYCSLISDRGISALSQKCRQLRAVKISYCGRVSGVGFKGCSQTLAYLEADSCKLDPEGILGMVSGGGLEYLNVSRSLVSLTAIGAGLGARLKILNCRTCRTIGDESVVAIAKGCPLLAEWNLSICHEVRILGWESIGLYCYNLERLHVNRCQNLCDRGLQALRDGCKRLSILYISHCRLTTSTAMELFKCLRGDVEIKEEEVMCIAPNWAFQRFRCMYQQKGLNFFSDWLFCSVSSSTACIWQTQPSARGSSCRAINFSLRALSLWSIDQIRACDASTAFSNQWAADESSSGCPIVEQILIYLNKSLGFIWINEWI